MNSARLALPFPRFVGDVRTDASAVLPVIGIILAALVVRALMPTEPTRSLSPRPAASTVLSKEQRRLVILANDNSDGAKALGKSVADLNAALPFSSRADVAAPFSLARASRANREAALTCMTQAIYYEAGYEPVEGRRAVAQVILNRLRHPAFPHSVCGVVYQGHSQPGCQFSFACDGARARNPEPRAWAEARKIAVAALAGYVDRAIGLATHYHASYVFPRWAPQLVKTKAIGLHLFYTWPGSWGHQGAFAMRYAGGEVVPPYQPVSAPETNLAALPEVARLPERRADNDLGGRIDPTKGWTLDFAAADATQGALAAVVNHQDSPVKLAAAASATRAER
jgi:spore germination cell wall hydrolase CwlJ-like protein